MPMHSVLACKLACVSTCVLVKLVLDFAAFWDLYHNVDDIGHIIADGKVVPRV